MSTATQRLKARLLGERDLAPRTTVVCLIALSLLIVLLRVHTYDEPFERDLNAYAVIAHEILNGRSLYAEVVDHKPPAIHVSYALAELIVGYGKQQMYFLGVTAALFTLFGVYAAGVAASGRRSLGVLAAAVWALVCHDLSLQANQPNTEAFINPCLIWALALLLQLRGPGYQWRRVSAIGLLFLLASLYKHVVIAPAALLCAAHWLLPPPELSRRRVFAQVAVVAGIGAVGWMSVAGYFFARGHFAAFYDWVFAFNQQYVGDTLANLARGLTPSILVPVLSVSVVPVFFLLAVLGVSLRVFRAERRLWMIFLACIVSTYCSVALPGWLHLHYWQFWLPVIALGFALFVHAAWKFEGRLRWLGLALAAVALLGLGVSELANFRHPARMWSALKYGQIFVAAKDLGEQINQIIEPDETFYEWGAEPGLYFASRRRPLTGVLASWHALPAFAGELSDEMTRQTLEDLRRAPPDLLIVSDGTARHTHISHPFRVWMDEYYVPFDHRGPFYLLARKGSRLEARVAARQAAASLP